MIIGRYPCCEGTFCVETPNRTPVWYPETCPHCGVAVWHRLSRFDPESWTAVEFEKIFIIDREKREIRRRDGRDTEIRIKVSE